MKKPDLSRYIPLGRKSSQPMQGGIFLLVVACLRAVVELMDNYLAARDALFETVRVSMIDSHRELIPGAIIQPFSNLVQGSLDFFPLFWLFMAWEVIDCYLYHWKDTRSIYLMRRLPDKWDLHRRCWGRPLIYTAGSIALAAVILLFYFAIYLVFTPAECLPF